MADGRPADGQKIAISARADWPFFPTADVKLSLPYGKGRVRLVYTIHGATFDKKQYTVTTAQLSGFASWAIAQVEKIERGFDANTPIPAVTDATVTVIPRYDNPGGKLMEFAVDGGFEVDFQQVVPAAGDKGAILQGVIPASGSSASEVDRSVPGLPVPVAEDAAEALPLPLPSGSGASISPQAPVR